MTVVIKLQANTY